MIKRFKKDWNFTIIDNNILNNNNISAGALKLLLKMLSFKDDFIFNKSFLIKWLLIDKNTLNKYLDELVKEKYVNIENWKIKDVYENPFLNKNENISVECNKNENKQYEIIDTLNYSVWNENNLNWKKENEQISGLDINFRPEIKEQIENLKKTFLSKKI